MEQPAKSIAGGEAGVGALASLLIVMFQASTHALISLYAIGVFLSFTLSQAGMVKHWLTQKPQGGARASSSTALAR
jgi:hypothetical protein